MSHELRDLNLRVVGLFAVGLLLFGLATHAMVGWLFRSLDRRAPPRSERVGEAPLPHLEETPGLQLGAIRRREERELQSYGWIDRDRGVVRIPIERAMQLLLERRNPPREK
jgi:hypothetical protein